MNAAELHVANMNWLFISVFVLFTDLTNALYPDQIGKFDWKLEYLGKPINLYLGTASLGGRIVVATEKNVVAAISERNGQVVWRRVYENGDEHKIDGITSAKTLATLSKSGTVLRIWDESSGALVLEKSLSTSTSKQYLNHICSRKQRVTRVSLEPQQHVEVESFSLKDGKLELTQRVPASWLKSSSLCEIIDNNIICFESNQWRVFRIGQASAEFSNIDSKELATHTGVKRIIRLRHSLDDTKTVFAIGGDFGTIFALLQDNKISVLEHLPVGKLVASFRTKDAIRYGVITPEKNTHYIKAYKLNGAKLEHDSEFDGSFILPSTSGSVEWFELLPIASTSKDGPLYRVFVVTDDHCVLYYTQSGRLLWRREEALSSVINAQYVDLPLTDVEARMEQEHDAYTDIFSVIVGRLIGQVDRLRCAVLRWIELLRQNKMWQSNSALIQDSELVRDDFGFHKAIVMTTTARKLFVVDSVNGRILWSRYLPQMGPLSKNGEPTIPIFVQRTTAHYPRGPLCTLLGKSDTGVFSLYSFDPITGSNESEEKLDFKVIQAFPLLELTEEFIRGLVLVDDAFVVHVYPKSAVAALDAVIDKTYFYVVDSATGTVTGHSVQKRDNRYQGTEVWRVNFPRSVHNILHVVNKNPLEHVHSMGRVLGDRSVLYKYLNPNLMCVVTEERDTGASSGGQNNGNSLHVYFIDGVTGGVVHSITHRRATGPVHMVHSENFVTYTIYNEKARRNEIVAVELYEGQSQANNTMFSSLAAANPRLVEQQSFILPTSVQCMHETETDKGITNKHVIIATPTGAIIEIPKMFLDPRRPVHPTPEHREEGLMPYIPELKLVPEQQVNYNRTVERVRGMATSVTSLESTCLFVVYGLDIFATRLAPSKHFDLLKDDFDHLLICIVLMALFVSSYATRYFAGRKSLRAAWK